MAFPSTYNITYYRGDSYEFTISPKNANGVAFDLVNFSGLFTVSTARGTTGTKIAQKAVTVDSNAGTIAVSIDPTTGGALAASGTYVYDVEIKKNLGGGASSVYTLLTGSLSVTDDITGRV